MDIVGLFMAVAVGMLAGVSIGAVLRDITVKSRAALSGKTEE